MKRLMAVAMAGGLACAAQAGFILEIDTDGADDNLVTYNAGFSYGNDTSTAPLSATATPFGATGGDSIFGGDGGSFPDTYLYNYSPDSQPDNLVIPFGQDLGEGNLGTGVVGGGAGTYRVYAAWPQTDNVSGGDTRYEVTSDIDSFTIDLNQNGRGNAWALLGEINYASGGIRVSQQPTGGNTFVSMRAYGLLFEPVPEPSALLLLGTGAVALLRRR